MVKIDCLYSGRAIYKIEKFDIFTKLIKVMEYKNKNNQQLYYFENLNT